MVGLEMHIKVDLSQASTQKELDRMIRANDALYNNYFKTVCDEAYKLCPYKSGRLAKSIYQFSYMKYDKSVGQLHAHFEAYAVSKEGFEYAYIIHENPNKRFRYSPGKTERFLENPFVDETNRLVNNLEGVVSRVW